MHVCLCKPQMFCGQVSLIRAIWNNSSQVGGGGGVISVVGKEFDMLF